MEAGAAPREDFDAGLTLQTRRNAGIDSLMVCARRSGLGRSPPGDIANHPRMENPMTDETKQQIDRLCDLRRVFGHFDHSAAIENVGRI